MLNIKIHRIQSGIRNESHNLNSNHSFNLSFLYTTRTEKHQQYPQENRHREKERKEMMWNVGMFDAIVQIAMRKCLICAVRHKVELLYYPTKKKEKCVGFGVITVPQTLE